jgi:hypothetical protein
VGLLGLCAVGAGHHGTVSGTCTRGDGWCSYRCNNGEWRGENACTATTTTTAAPTTTTTTTTPPTPMPTPPTTTTTPPTPAPTTSQGYALVYSGKCSDATRITTAAECEKAAGTLSAIKDTSHQVSAGWMRGCWAYHAHNSAHTANVLYFSDKSNDTKDCQSNHPCICRK